LKTLGPMHKRSDGRAREKKAVIARDQGFPKERKP